MTDAQPLLICFDGSEGSTRAIAAAADLFPRAHAVIVHVWSTTNLGTTGYAGAPMLSADVQQTILTTAEEQATATLEDGKKLARQAGFEVEGFAYVTPSTPWRELLAAADDVGAKLIVAGSRGRGDVKSLVLGSTSQGLAHHTKVPLLIVPGDTERER